MCGQLVRFRSFSRSVIRCAFYEHGKFFGADRSVDVSNEIDSITHFHPHTGLNCNLVFSVRLNNLTVCKVRAQLNQEHQRRYAKKPTSGSLAHISGNSFYSQMVLIQSD
jgi:hypothetical protein